MAEKVLLKLVLVDNEDGTGGFRRDIYPKLVNEGSLAHIVLLEATAQIDEIFEKLQKTIGGELKAADIKEE